MRFKARTQVRSLFKKTATHTKVNGKREEKKMPNLYQMTKEVLGIMEEEDIEGQVQVPQTEAVKTRI